ncbi:MAG: protein kinase domain-containing protein [Candidatus Promineifilaceae bacterium]
MQANQGANELLNERYELLERVGSGGMASVYRAQDRRLGRIVAVKSLHYSLTDDPVFLQKFRKEAHAVANLAHPNIVTVHDIGQDDNKHFIVMEFVEGQTLKQLIRNQPEGRPISIQRALDLTIQICSGLGYAHRAGLVHCDMKPQNVLVAPDERVKVTDFGIARAISEATVGGEQVWGTPHYFAPEQARGLRATPSSDVYSLGIILYELLTGQLPFSAETHTALALKHIQEEPPRAGDLNPNIPEQLDDILAKVMSKEPVQRYRTAGQFGRILATYRQRGFEETEAYALPRNYTTEFFPRPPRENRQPDDTQQPTPTRNTPIREATPGPQPPVQPTDTDNAATQIFSRNNPIVRPEPLEETEAVEQQVPVRQQTPVRPAFPAHIPPIEYEDPYPESIIDELATEAEFDWVAVALGIIALIAVLGLIPLWYAVYIRALP